MRGEEKGDARGLGQGRMPAERVRGNLSIKARAAAGSPSEDLHTVVATFGHQNLALPIYSYAPGT